MNLGGLDLLHIPPSGPTPEYNRLSQVEGIADCGAVPRSGCPVRPAFFRASSCKSSFCSWVETRAYPIDDIGSKVVITSNGTWHQQFKDVERHVADYTKCDARTAAILNVIYNQVIAKLK